LIATRWRFTTEEGAVTVQRCIRSGITLLTLAMASATQSLAAATTTVVLGTATKGGGFEVYGAALAEVVNQADATLRVETRATKGSAENLPLLEAGQLDIGLVEGNAARVAFDGVGRPSTRLRVVAAMYPGPGMFVVRRDSPYRTITDLKAKPVAFGTRGSGLTLLARDVLDGLGLSPERDFKAVFLEKAGDGPALVLEGKVAALWGGGLGWPGFIKIASGPGGARFIVPDAGEIRRIQSEHPFLKTMTVPANTYPGQNAPLVSVGLWSFVLARADLPEDVAYRLARALHRGEATLGARLAQARYTTAANTANETPRVELIHSGVARYLREIGVLR
jgi:TRAP transporter TAXI family solute receptor